MSFDVTDIDSEFCGAVISLLVSVEEVVPTNDDIIVVPGAIEALDIVSNDTVISDVSSGSDELSDFCRVSDIRVASGDDVVIIGEVVEELWNEFDVLSIDSVSNSGIVLDDCEMDG